MTCWWPRWHSSGRWANCKRYPDLKNYYFSIMKNPLLYLLPALLLVVGCGTEVAEEETPQDLAEIRQLLAEKQTELRTLKSEIADLEGQIETLDPNARKRVLVSTRSVDRTDFNHYVEIQGSIQTDDVVMVSSEMGGRVIDLKVQEGQSVNRGQLIAKLDLESIQKQIAEVETSLDLAREVYERQQRLWEQNIGSELQYLEAQNAVDRLERTLETLQFNYEKSSVYAPISGVVERVIVKEGEMTGPGSPIVQILNTREVMVVADVPENYLRAVQKGEMVDIEIPALNDQRKAKVTEVGRTINPGNRTFNIEVDLDNRNGLLKPNLLATVLINDYSEEDVITVPIELVQQEVGGKSYVFIVGESANGAVAQKVYVETGESYAGEIVIKTGLEGGESLIIEGARGLTNEELITTRQIEE
jgi:membrane fusion protein (multidrug efflux system)